MLIREDRPALPWTPALVGVLILSGCTSYNSRTGKALEAFRIGRFEEASERFAKSSKAGSSFLAGAESGMAALAGGDFERAVTQFDRAAQAARGIEDQGLLDPESLVQSLTGFLLNESTQDYQGEGYERVMLHACLALAYLGQGDVQSMLVETRRANQLLGVEEKLYEVEYAAGGLAHFLSALGYELRGEPDEAYIDYKALQAKGLGQPLVGRALVRSAKILRREDELPRWLELYGEAEPIPTGASNIVLIAGVGLGPYKQEARLDVPTRDGIFSWSVPALTMRAQSVRGVTLFANDTRVDSIVVEDVSEVASRNLSDRLGWLAARSAVRAVFKRELTKELEREHGPLGRLVGDLFTFVTERADLRAWTTLPDTWQVARVYSEPGVVDLSLSALGGAGVDLGSFELEPGEHLFIVARTVGTRLYAYPIGGRRLDGPSAVFTNPTAEPKP